ncbi:hypothetical protein [Cohnella rhizosphaerae]|uniref:Uncharacterized protein n=1 Tax=Cohnella rhizosphaerae TaxID=1457232 RepID=A0A9X4QSX8_9BACL|nr:hypothetical protein [Cohnella rhizosphaerae]MDG0809067.1 hypothetical protein [Cohnella rhizosphaerae]
MANPDKKAEQWKEAKQRCRLNDDDIRMAKEMGLNPLSLIKNIPAKNQMWKIPVKAWIHEMYEERERKKEMRRKMKEQEPTP